MPDITTTLTETELFLRIAEGSEQAFAELFRSYGRLLYPTLYRLTKSPEAAEEIIQEAMLKVWLNRDKLPGIENPRAWIFRIASNIGINWLRKQSADERTLRQVRIAAPADNNLVESTVSLRELQAQVQKAVSTLSPQRRRIYELSRNQGFKNDEIAEALSLSVNTVKSALAKSLQHIRENLQAEGYHLAIIYLILLQK